MTASSLDQRLQALVGEPLAEGGPTASPDPVNEPMIRHWAAAFEDANPVYTDPDAAAGSRFGGIVAPPLMLQTWTMATPRITGMAERGGSPVEGNPAVGARGARRRRLRGTLASNSEFEIVRYLRLGDHVWADTVLESVSPEKQTRLGAGLLRHLGHHLHRWATRWSAGSASASSSSDRRRRPA